MPLPYFIRDSSLAGFSLNGGSRSDFSMHNINYDIFVTNSNYNLEEPERVKPCDSNFYTVALAYDRNTGQKVEMIKYHDLLRNNWNWKLSLKILNELKVYNTLTDQTKMLTLIDFMLVVKFRCPKDDYRKIFNCEFKDIYVVYERFGHDLDYILNSKEPPAEMKTHQTQQWLLSELLSAVSSLHSQKLIHRNIRPSNVTVSLEKKVLKLRSFGLSCAISSNLFLKEEEEDNDEEEDSDEEKDDEGNEKITPIYTPPEIILGQGGASSPSVDVWGVGCIFAEILSGGGGSPLFFLPASETKKPTVFNKIGVIVATLQHNRGSCIDKLSSNPLAIDLLKRMLDLNPHTRISVEEAKQHPYFEKHELVVGGGSSSRVAAEADDEDMGVAVEQVTESTASAAAGLGWVEVTEPDKLSLRKLIWNEMKTFEMKKQLADF